MADQIRVNGAVYSWGSIIAKFDGDPFAGFSEISYGDKLERVKSYGMARHHAPQGRSAGKYSTDPVKIKGRKGSAQALRDYLATRASDGASYGTVEFALDVQFVEPAVDGGETPIHVHIGRCVVSADVSSHSESADPLMDELELDCMFIERNGLTLFDGSKGRP